jgi:pimeloyl-[acyl-carrier protein] methyl ester esterase
MLALQAAPSLTDEISGVLLISTTPRFCRDDSQEWGIPQATVRAMTAGLRTEPERTLERFYVSSAAPEEPDPIEMAKWVRECLLNPDGLHTGLQYLRHTDLRPHMSCGGLPAVLIHGRGDAIIPYTASRTIGIRLRPCRMDLTSDAGHDLPLRRPDVVVKGLHSLLMMCPG